MDVRLINPFIASTVRVFDVMLGLPIEVGKPSVARRRASSPQVVNAVIRLRGGASGALVLRFPQSLVVPMARRMDPGVSALESAVDAIGELANMITGSAKSGLTSHVIEISVPAVTTGSDGMGALDNFRPWLVVPFESSLGSFDLSVSYRAERATRIIAVAGSNQTVPFRNTKDGKVTVQLDGSASSPREAIRSYEWIEDGVVIATEVSPKVGLDFDEHTITLRVVGTQGQEASDTTRISVVAE